MQDQDYIKIHDLLEIIIFINPHEMQKMLIDRKLFRSLKLIRLKIIVRKHHGFTNHYTYYVWIIYRWILLHLDLQHYDSSHLLSPPQLSCWDTKSFWRIFLQKTHIYWEIYLKEYRKIWISPTRGQWFSRSKSYN